MKFYAEVSKNYLRKNLKGRCHGYGEYSMLLEIEGSTMEEAVKNRVHDLVYDAKADSQIIISYPENVEIKVEKIKYANMEKKNMYALIPCIVSTAWKKGSPNYREYLTSFKIAIHPESDIFKETAK